VFPHVKPTAYRQSSCYFLYCADQSKFETLTEGEILEILCEKMLEKEEFQLLKERIEQVLECKSNT